MATRLQRAQYRAVGVWALRGNAAGRRFCERRGGTPLDGDAGIRLQGRFTEVAYGWPDLAALLAPRAPRPGSRPPPRPGTPERARDRG